MASISPAFFNCPEISFSQPSGNKFFGISGHPSMVKTYIMTTKSSCAGQWQKDKIAFCHPHLALGAGMPGQSRLKRSGDNVSNLMKYPPKIKRFFAGLL
jgi:hypothetical protein